MEEHKYRVLEKQSPLHSNFTKVPRKVEEIFTLVLAGLVLSCLLGRIQKEIKF